MIPRRIMTVVCCHYMQLECQHQNVWKNLYSDPLWGQALFLVPMKKWNSGDQFMQSEWTQHIADKRFSSVFKQNTNKAILILKLKSTKIDSFKIQIFKCIDRLENKAVSACSSPSFLDLSCAHPLFQVLWNPASHSMWGRRRNRAE